MTVRRVAGDHYLLGPQATVRARAAATPCSCARTRRSTSTTTSRRCCSSARAAQTLIINDPRGLREQNEKLAVLELPRPLPADDRHARGDAGCARSWPSRAARWWSSRSTPPAASACSTCARAIPTPARSSSRRPTWAAAGRWRRSTCPRCAAGDKRILLVDGEPLCAVLRVPAPDDARGNLHVGARPMATKLDERDRDHRRRAGPAPARARPLLRRPRRDRRLAHRDQRHQPDRHPRGQRALRRDLRGEGRRAARAEDRRGPRSNPG